MKKRNLFAEIAEGFDALADERAGKHTLRTHELEMKPAPAHGPPLREMQEARHGEIDRQAQIGSRFRELSGAFRRKSANEGGC